jgi:hypothetical protein
MRFRTAAILSVVLVGGMFATSIAGGALARWHLGRGELEIPNYERMFFGIAAFCSSFRVLLAIPIVSVLFTIATFTNQARQRR